MSSEFDAVMNGFCLFIVSIIFAICCICGGLWRIDFSIWRRERYSLNNIEIAMDRRDYYERYIEKGLSVWREKISGETK